MLIKPQSLKERNVVSASHTKYYTWTNRKRWQSLHCAARQHQGIIVATSKTLRDGIGLGIAGPSLPRTTRMLDWVSRLAASASPQPQLLIEAGNPVFTVKLTGFVCTDSFPCMGIQRAAIRASTRRRARRVRETWPHLEIVVFDYTLGIQNIICV
jgi:hypothetical protein